MGPAVAPQFKDWGLFVNSPEKAGVRCLSPER